MAFEPVHSDKQEEELSMRRLVRSQEPTHSSMMSDDHPLRLRCGCGRHQELQRAPACLFSLAFRQIFRDISCDGSEGPIYILGLASTPMDNSRSAPLFQGRQTRETSGAPPEAYVAQAYATLVAGKQSLWALLQDLGRTLAAERGWRVRRGKS